MQAGEMESPVIWFIPGMACRVHNEHLPTSHQWLIDVRFGRLKEK